METKIKKPTTARNAANGVAELGGSKLHTRIDEMRKKTEDWRIR
jgi:hypothetical protein